MEIFTLVGKIAIDGMEYAQAEFEELEKRVKQSEKIFKATGVAMSAFGASITAALTLATKGAIDEENSISQLDAALKNVGTSYNVVKDSLEGVIAATSKKTAVSDEDQRKALGDLVTYTGSYARALDLLPAALDFSASKHTDLSSAAMIVGKVAQGNVSILTRYGIVMKEGATAAQALAELQKRQGGAAEAAGNTTAGAMKKVKNSLEELMASFGQTLLPIIKKASDAISGLIDKWKALSQEQKDSIVIVAGVTGAWATLIGVYSLTIVSVIPKLVLALKGLWLTLSTNPIGLVITAAAALAGVALLVAQNWEAITDPIGVSIRRQTEIIKDGLNKQRQAAIDKLAQDRTDAQKAYDDKVASITALYGLEKANADSIQQIRRDTTDAA